MAADKRRNGGGMAYGENIEKKEEMNNEKWAKSAKAEIMKICNQ
jgi:hypothetical protein